LYEPSDILTVLVLEDRLSEGSAVVFSMVIAVVCGIVGFAALRSRHRAVLSSSRSA
jgi:hypothetical protein